MCSQVAGRLRKYDCNTKNQKYFNIIFLNIFEKILYF
jgi:hypothetical protein